MMPSIIENIMEGDCKKVLETAKVRWTYRFKCR